MATISQALALAVQHHQAGRLQLAEQIYWQILAVEPKNADALNLLGILASQTGRPTVAHSHIARAVAIQPNNPGYHNNLGRASSNCSAATRRRLRSAALALKADFADALTNLGLLLRDDGKLAEAIDCFQRALKANPRDAAAQNSLGSVLQRQGKFAEAIASYRQALQLRPDSAEAHSNLGSALAAAGQLDEAAASCQRAVQLNPNMAQAHNNLGTVLKDQGKLDMAAASYRRAIQAKPDFAEAHNNLGAPSRARLSNAGEGSTRPSRATGTIELNPGYARACSNLGAVSMEVADLDEAVACFPAPGTLARTMRACTAIFFTHAEFLCERRRANNLRRASPLEPAARRALGEAYPAPQQRPLP